MNGREGWGRRVTQHGSGAMAAMVDDGPAVPRTPPVAVRSSVAHRGLTMALAAMRLGPLMILVLLVAVLSVVSDVFLSFENVGNVLKQSAVVCVLALGQLLVILTRGIDLSVGANLSLSAVVGAIVWRDHGSATLAIVAALATGSLVGADQRRDLREGSVAAPVHPDVGDAVGGQRPRTAPGAQRDDPGRAADREHDRYGANLLDPGRRRHRVVPGRDRSS